MKSLRICMAYAIVLSILPICIGHTETSGVTAIHNAPDFYSANQMITVTTDIICEYTLTALGLSVTLPNGWSFESTSGVNVPEITKVDNNIVSFAWKDNLFPKTISFSYDTKAPSYAKSDQIIRAKVLYREGASDEKEISVIPYALVIQADIDQDGDNYPNSQDAFPDDPNEWLDTDGDKIGNNADTDDDNDDMPDDWEIEHGFDPLVFSANDDPDFDGISNYEEFKQGTPPLNFHPDIPTLLSPINNQEMPLTPTLISGPFDDSNETDIHYATEWQISKQSSFDVLVYKLYSNINLLETDIPDCLLEPGQTYYWRACHYDNYNECSLWGTSQFRTIEQNNYDNGIPVDQKVPDDTDLDKDGVYDNQQAAIKSLTSIVGDVQIGMKSESPDQYTVAMACSIDPVSIEETENRPAQLPFGLLAFKLRVDSPGDIAIVSAHYSSPLPEKALWYTYNDQSGWQSFMPQLSADRSIVTLILKDGGDGDADGVANGIIVDPSGPGIPDSGPSKFISTPELVDDVDNGSCFIHSIYMNGLFEGNSHHFSLDNNDMMPY